MEHSILPPSSAHIWGGGCTGWVSMALATPETEESEDSKAGTVSHDISESLMKGNKPLQVGQIAPNGLVVTHEMVEGAELYANDYNRVRNEWDGTEGHTGGIEHRLDLFRIHPDCFGTADGWQYNPVLNHLIIWDYKFGHLYVDVFRNKQLTCYAAGLRALRNIPKDCKVTFRIVQPRSYHPDGTIRDWVTTMGDLYPMITELSTAAHKALSPRAELKTGPYCRYCDARYQCPPALRAGISLYEMAATPMPVELPPEAVGLQLKIIERAMEQLKGLKTGYEEQVKSLIKTGRNVPGFSIQNAMGREKWDKPIDEVIALGKLLLTDLSKPSVVTPNQARELGIDDETLKLYASKPVNGLKLVSEDADAIRRIFE